MSNKIRVLHTFNIMNRGGAETLIMNIYRKIDKEMFEFDFLCEKSEPGNYDDEIRSLGGKIYHLVPNKKRPIKNIINIVKFLKETGPYDVVHIPNMFYSGVYCVAAKLAKVDKIIVHSHNAGDSKRITILRKAYMKLMRIIINLVSDVKISCGDDAARFLFGSTNNVIILNNGVDLKKFLVTSNTDKVKKEFRIINEKVIANIARFVPEKNHIFFIGLGNYIKKENLNFKILLIGDGNLRPKIEYEIKKNKLEDIIICTGLRTDIDQLLRITDVVVMPSIHEGFPVTVVETLASGTPCVLSENVDKKTAIIPEMVKFVHLNEDYNEWIRVIDDLANTCFDIKNIQDKIRKAGFDINYSTKVLEKIYSNYYKE